MTAFQFIAVAVLAVAFIAELVHAGWSREFTAISLARSLTWTTAAVAILFPGLIQTLAWKLGIHRGADLVMYLFILTSIILYFINYSFNISIQRKITELIRCHAIEHARRGRPTKNNFEKIDN